MVTVTWNMAMFKADAQKCYDELKGIDSPTPQDVVNIAEDENTELHKCFEWDDREASKKWRLFQARQVLCNLVVVKQEPDEEEEKTRVFLNVDRSTQKYTKIQLVLKNEDQYTRLLEQAKRDFKKLQVKYRTLKELQELFDLIEEL